MNRCRNDSPAPEILYALERVLKSVISLSGKDAYGEKVVAVGDSDADAPSNADEGGGEGGAADDTGPPPVDDGDASTVVSEEVVKSSSAPSFSIAWDAGDDDAENDDEIVRDADADDDSMRSLLYPHF